MSTEYNTVTSNQITFFSTKKIGMESQILVLQESSSNLFIVSEEPLLGTIKEAFLTPILVKKIIKKLKN
jgi:hypothetical protein